MTGLDFLKRQIIRHKDLLVNLSRKNKELFYSESKGSSVNLSKLPFPKNAFKEKFVLKFEPLKYGSDAYNDILKGQNLDLSKYFHVDEVQDSELVKKFNAKLDKVRLVDDQHQREYGISGAWLLGPFLCWRLPSMPAKRDLMITPIFKIAIDLKKSPKKTFLLNSEESLISINPTLRFCLKLNFGILLPEDETFESPEQAVDILIMELAKHDKNIQVIDADVIPKSPPKQKTIKDEDGNITERVDILLEEALSSEELNIYNTITNTNFGLISTIYLDQLNASRMVLLNDYDEIISAGIDHPILNELFNGTTSMENLSSDREKLRELDSYKERENHFVIDVDSTQHRAIDSATKSKAIVIQGPPGSGKSQTIVNLIADYLAKGKKVLFVSDKRPALDVVFNRMKGAQIESQSVLIHSSDLNKSDLYKSFLELAGATPNTADEYEWNNTSSSLDRIKFEINQYANILQKVQGSTMLTVADIIILASNTDKTLYAPAISNSLEKLTYNHLLELSHELNSLQVLLLRCPQFAESPWIHRFESTVRTNNLEFKLQELKKLYSSYRDRLDALNATIEEHTGARADEANIAPIKSISAAKLVDAEYANLWSQKQEDIIKVLSVLTSLLKICVTRLEANYDFYCSIKPIFELSMIEELEVYYRLPRGFADWFSGSFWSYRKIRIAACPNWDGTNRQFAGYREYIKSFEELKRVSSSFNTNSDLKIEQHAASVSWLNLQIGNLESLHSFFSEVDSKLPKKMTFQLRQSVDEFNFTIDSIQKIKDSWDEVKKINLQAQSGWSAIGEFVSIYPKFVSIDQQVKHLESMINSIGDLDVLDRFDIETKKLSARFELPQLKDIILKNLKINSGTWDQVVISSVLNGWRDNVVSQYSPLRTFDRTWIENLSKSFKEISEKHKTASRQAVHQAFAKRWSDPNSDREGLPLLKKESSKVRRVFSPREIMERGALKTMMALKPCWLMSPLSISQMLPLQKCLFDVIIFDEASQVRVEDAIPSIYRAATMIVVGDNKQMPPTNFFGGSLPEDEEEGDEPLAPSVLDLATMVYPSVLLEWHYRSRSESLIAFSNRAFYGGKLIAAPNPQVLTASGALKFNKVESAYFTSKNGNIVEANAVVDKLIKLLKDEPERSFGVIAMGQSQAVAIEEVLDNRMESDTEVRSLIEKARAFKDGDADAGFFIKNLENVQGDERDVILMSVGYAPPAPGKKLRHGFGPLSSSGGGRRLNVAVTRAKTSMQVFCSFSPSELSSDEETFTQKPDACIFARYLKYVEAVSAENLDVALDILNSFGMSGAITSRKSSRFALDVKKRLEEIGYIVSKEIGTSGFYIDLGIHHPTLNSNFILGIECDGAFFHSTPYARDRDKIRQSLLESRGWKIERVWSQDWSRDWKAEIAKLDKAIKAVS
jgi:superfamily I DNA and/or RNA helicase